MPTSKQHSATLNLAQFDGYVGHITREQVDALLAECKRMREQIERLRALAWKVSAHFGGTDAPLGIEARALYKAGA